MFVNDSVKGLISTLTGAHKELIFLQLILLCFCFAFSTTNINICSFFFRMLIKTYYVRSFLKEPYIQM